MKERAANGKSVLRLADESREVPGLPKYRVNGRGRVEWRRTKALTYDALGWDVMQPYLSDGRRYVRLSQDGKKHDHQVADLVLRAGVGKPPAGKPNVRHINDKMDDDSLGNLEWSSGRQFRPRKPR